MVAPWVCADLDLGVGLCQSRCGGGVVRLLDDLGLGVGLHRSRHGLGFARRSRLRHGGLRRSQRGLEFAQRSWPGRGFALISAWSWVCSTISVWVWVCANLGVVVCLRRSRCGGGAVGVIEGSDEERGKKKCYEEREKKLK